MIEEKVETFVCASDIRKFFKHYIEESPVNYYLDLIMKNLEDAIDSARNRDICVIV